MKRTAALLLALFVGLAMTASAEPIDYDETVDGPLPIRAAPGPFGPELADFLPLDRGANRFRGTAAWNNEGLSTFDTAPFFFLPAGLSIHSITLTVSNIQPSSPGDVLSHVRARIYTYDAGVTQVVTFSPAITTGQGDIGVPVTGVSLFRAVMPRNTPGTYAVGFHGMGGSLSGQSIQFDYEWTITVGDVVPSLPLAGHAALVSAMGITGVVMLRRRAR
jgi:hypothetical protein